MSSHTSGECHTDLFLITEDNVISWGHIASPHDDGYRWIPHTKASNTELWWFFCSCVWINDWVNNREAGESRRHRGHYDVTVLCFFGVFCWNRSSMTAIRVTDNIPGWPCDLLMGYGRWITQCLRKTTLTNTYTHSHLPLSAATSDVSSI